MIRTIAIALMMLFAGSVSAQSVRFPSVAVGGSAAGPEISGWMYKPSGAGPFPGIVLAHPCSGVSPHTEIGASAASWGYVVVAPDLFGPRGEKSVCGRGNVVSGSMRVPDVAGAIDFLNAQPFVRKGDIGLIGHSHGGWTAVRAVQGNYGLAARGLKAAVAYYPSCVPSLDRDVAVPLLILIGDKDDWTPAERCRQPRPAASRGRTWSRSSTIPTPITASTAGRRSHDHRGGRQEPSPGLRSCRRPRCGGSHQGVLRQIPALRLSRP